MDKEKNKKTSKVRSFKEFNPKKYVEVKPKLDEATNNKVAVISFGRMNPPTIGHEKLVAKVADEAKKRKGIPGVYLSHTSDKKKNPLSYNDKVDFAIKAFHRIIKRSNAKTILQVAEELQNEFGHLVVVAGSDRVKEFDTLLNKYNGNLYNYESIEVVSAGDRDPDAEGVSGMSASKMRALASQGDLETFTKGLPRKLQPSAEQVFNAVRAGMGVKEDVDLDEVLDPAARRKRSLVMRKHAKKIARARARAMKRKASKEKLQSRAEKQVIKGLKDKFSKDKNYDDLSFSQKQAIEKRIKKISAARIKTLVKKKLPDVKAKERERISKRIDVNESSNLDELSMATKMKARLARGARGPSKKATPTWARETGKAARDQKKRAERTKEYERQKAAMRKKGAITSLGMRREESDINAKAAAFLQERDERKKTSPQDPDIKDMPGTQPKSYYKGVEKDKKDDRARHFKRKAKMDDDNPKAYTPAPGDKEAKTKPSQHTKKFKKMFGEVVEACLVDTRVKKRPHMLMAKAGGVKFDNRFKVYKAWKKKWDEFEKQQLNAVKEENEDLLSQIYDLQESVEDLFESNPEKSLKKKAEKTGISYGILKKVFDRGVAAWRTGHRPGTTPTQWGLARVNSFATGGKTRTTADADLWKQHRGK